MTMRPYILPMHSRRAATFAWFLSLLAVPVLVNADSDLQITCGPEFAVFDRFVPGGRMLNIVPWVNAGNLTVAATTQLPSGQPHRWAIYERYVVVRMWNDVYIYRLDDVFQPRLVTSARIDDDRSNVGGTTEIRVDGSVLSVYGITRTLRLDLASCTPRCELRPGGVAGPPPQAVTQERCSVARNGLLFAESRTTTSGNKAVYHDLSLTRRRTNPLGVRPAENPFAPTSILYVGTRLETVD